MEEDVEEEVVMVVAVVNPDACMHAQTIVYMPGPRHGRSRCMRAGPAQYMHVQTAELHLKPEPKESCRILWPRRSSLFSSMYLSSYLVQRFGFGFGLGLGLG